MFDRMVENSMWTVPIGIVMELNNDLSLLPYDTAEAVAAAAAATAASKAGDGAGHCSVQVYQKWLAGMWVDLKSMETSDELWRRNHRAHFERHAGGNLTRDRMMSSHPLGRFPIAAVMQLAPGYSWQQAVQLLSTRS